ncbi:DNA/RNA endonuclease G [Leucobacter sp. USCH14]|uniref:DNA/RNA endonuclease G n=1 Tax=Leucobacter sp. USCH14 TaxID=3024838 RepID=UPI0030A879A7
MSNSVLNRGVRRETHSPRTVAAVAVLVVLAAAAVFVGIEIVRWLTGLGPLLVTPGDGLNALAQLPDAEPQGAVVAGGAIAALLGLVLVWLAIGPGRRPRHALSGHPIAVVCDNGVLASAIAEQLRRSLDLAPGAVVVGVGSRSIDVTVRPAPGQNIEKDRVRALAAEEIDRYELSPGVKVHARIAKPADEEGRDR